MANKGRDEMDCMQKKEELKFWSQEMHSRGGGKALPNYKTLAETL
jgi:hypothetical protein